MHKKILWSIATVTHLFSYSPIQLFTFKNTLSQGRETTFTLVGATHVDMSKNNRKIAYTLAETLITLGIIGVVAAITMPTLINKIQDRQNIAKWKREYSLISNAFQSVVNEDIEVSLPISYNYSPGYTDEFLDAFESKLKIVDMCSGQSNSTRTKNMCDNNVGNNPNTTKYRWSGIAHGIYSRYKAYGSDIERKTNASEYGVNAYNFNDYVYLLSDGAAVYMGHGNNGPFITVDVNNFTQGPNEFGRDVFVMRVLPAQKMIKALGADGTVDILKNQGINCVCSKNEGLKSSNNFVIHTGDSPNYLSGVCCGAKFLLE